MNGTETEQLRLSYGALPATLAATLSVALVLIYGLWSVVEPAALLGWITTLGLVALLRFGLLLGYHRCSEACAQRRAWRDWFVAGAALAGLVWGVAGIWLFPAGNLPYQMLLALVLAGIGFGAVISHAFLFASATPFVLLALLPITLRFATDGTEIGRIVALMLGLFILFTLNSARRISTITRENIGGRRQSRHQEELLREGEERYRSIFNHAPLGLLHYDAEGVILECNERLVAILGSTRKTLLGLDMLHSMRDDGVLRALRDSLEGGVGRYEGVYSSATSDRRIPVRVFFRAIRSNDDELLGGVGIVEDISEQVQGQEELRTAKEAAERANRAKSTFLANMGHEFRTPLNAILGFTGLVEKHAPNPQMREFAVGIRKAGGNLLTIVEDVLDLAQLEVGQLTHCPYPLVLADLMHEVYGFYSTEARNKRLEYRLQLSPGLPQQVSVDRVRLRQVLLKLISNAIKFTDRGTVLFTVEPLADEGSGPGRIGLRFVVDDTGKGISGEDQPHLFQPFWQQEEGDERAHGGIGGSLALCKGIAQMLGGEITVESRIGVGSRFELCLHDLPVVARGGEAVTPIMLPDEVAVGEGTERCVDLAPARVSEIIDRLQEECMPLWLVAERTKALHQIQLFAECVRRVSDQYGLPCMQGYAGTLLDAVERIDIICMSDNLDAFPELIERLAAAGNGAPKG